MRTPPGSRRAWMRKTYVEDRVRRRMYEIGEETCVNCDTQIKYKAEKGKNVVACP